MNVLDPAAGSGLFELRDEESSWNFREGDELLDGRYVLERLGGGAECEVYLVWDERLFAHAVAKVVRPALREDARALRHLERESHWLRTLAHPVLVRGLDGVRSDRYPHLLMEHLEGPTLHRLVKRHGPLAMEQWLPLALQLASATHYLAREGVVHLDLKPANVIVGMQPRLIDLSIARTLEDATTLTEAIGTASYMAPEQCAPVPGQIGPPADRWGLGATLYFACTGAPPYFRTKTERRSEDPAVRYPQLARAPDPLPAGLPEPVVQVVTRLLSQDPTARPTAAEIAAMLEPLVAGLSRQGRPSPARQPVDATL